MEKSGKVGSGSGPPLVSELPLHPAIAPLQFLLGRWSGEGEGGFPTIKSFRYGEELFFSHSGKVLPSFLVWLHAAHEVTNHMQRCFDSMVRALHEVKTALYKFSDYQWFLNIYSWKKIHKWIYGYEERDNNEIDFLCIYLSSILNYCGFVASDSIHPEDMEVGIRRANACGERLLALETWRVRWGRHCSEHRPRWSTGHLSFSEKMWLFAKQE